MGPCVVFLSGPIFPYMSDSVPDKEDQWNTSRMTLEASAEMNGGKLPGCSLV